MLLPSDVARLVLGYLQQEKLTATCKSFIAESPNLKEYAEYHTDDGVIPGCLLSLFGKNLTVILNEYVTFKANENEAEVPFMISSLWKKLDLTLSQIRSMQESAAFQNLQRARTRKAINDRMTCQKMLTTPLGVCASPLPSHPVVPQTSTPVMATQYVLHPLITSGASPSVSALSFSGPSTMQTSTPAAQTSTSTSQIVPAASVQKKLPTAATSSPMRRKPDAQRRRRIAPSTAAEKDAGLDSESIQGIISDDFPQLVIENAREKILSNKSLQEKLAENINKILASDSATQTTKQGEGAPADDTSIDEILGLQGGEIHMTEEAIHDILAQTELDPDFQELYNLFACVTSKAPKSTSRDPSAQISETKVGVSKKQDAKENSEPASNDPVEKEPDGSNAGTSSAGAVGKSQQSGTSEATSSTSQTSGEDKLNDDLVIIDSSDSETIMDTSTEAQTTVIKAPSPIQDVDMDVSTSEEAAGDDCVIVEDVPSKVSAGEEPTSPTKTCPGDPVTVNASEMMEDSAKERPSDTPETEKTLAATPPTANALPGVPLEAVPAPVLNCSGDQTEKDSQAGAESSPLKPDKTDKAESAQHAVSQKTPVKAAPPCPSSLAPEMVTYSTEIVVPSETQAVLDSNILTLNIITEDLSEDVEISTAVQSINGEDYPTIILSPVVNAQEAGKVPGAPGVALEFAVAGEQTQLLATSTESLVNSINLSNGDCTVYAVAGTSATADGNVIQLVPASGATFAPTSNLIFSSCVANNVPAKQPNLMMLSNSSSNGQKQGSLFQTPPRPGSVYTVGQTMSPKLSQASTYILASPVQPVLQGMMFPMSLVGQTGSTFTPQTHQILHVPITKPVVPKLPLPPMSQKPLPKPAATSGKPVSNAQADSTSRSASTVQRKDNGEKKPASEVQRPLPDSSIVMKPVEAHRRVLCFDGSSALNSPSTSNARSQRSDASQNITATTETRSSKTSKDSNKREGSTVSKDSKKHEGSAVSKDSKKPDSSTVSKESKKPDRSTVSKESKKPDSSTVSKESKKPESSTASKDSKKPENSKEKSSKADAGPESSKEVSGEKRSPITNGESGGNKTGESGGNKENVMQTVTEKHGLGPTEKRTNSQETVNAEKNVKSQQEAPRTLPSILRRTPQKKPSERVYSTSPLAKQASQLLQDIQFQSPPSKQRSPADLPIPKTPGSGMEDKLSDKPSEHRRTPMRRYNEDLGTPKPMMPPATPELPTCSPASEAGSESSVNMAAHTLMILSRASIAKSSPLKDNTTQSKSSKSSGKKRRLVEEAEEYPSQSQRKEPPSPSSLHKKKKTKKRKRSMDAFPAGMDVDKFLMSLHYDE